MGSKKGSRKSANAPNYRESSDEEIEEVEEVLPEDEEATVDVQQPRYYVTRTRQPKKRKDTAPAKERVVRGRGRGRGGGRGEGSTSNPDAPRQQVPMIRFAPPVRNTQVKNYTIGTMDVYAIRKQNPLRVPKESGVVDPRFHNSFQCDWYQTVIHRPKVKNPIFPMKFLNDVEMRKKNIPVMMEVLDAIEKKGLTYALSFSYDWNQEIIAQFYATLWLEAGTGQNPEAILHWRTQGVDYSIKKLSLARLWGFDVRDTNKDALHAERPLSNSEIAFMYEDVPDAAIGFKKDLKPFYYILTNIFRLTLDPKGGDASKISGFSRNILVRMAPSADPFSVFHFLWDNIVLASISNNKSCIYGNWIMYMIESVTKCEYAKDGVCEAYTPKMPPRDPAAPPAATRRSRAAPMPSTRPSTHSSSFIVKALRSIFSVCRSNADILHAQSQRIRKVEERQYRIASKLELDPPLSPVESLPEIPSPPVFEDPFAGYYVPPEYYDPDLGGQEIPDSSDNADDGDDDEETEDDE